MICTVRHCGRLASAALPLPAGSVHNFDIRTYCSRRCADLHSGNEHRRSPGPFITCDVCVEDRPLTDYIHTIKKQGVAAGQWNIPIPSGCLPHIAPEYLDLESGTCTDCLRSHVLTQFKVRGAVNINCIQTHHTSAPHVARTQNWLPYAHHFLPSDQHNTFHRQLFDSYIHTTNTTLWICSSNCGYKDGILEANHTPGFPHVECSGCNNRFCANCKVPWHTGQTCQQYRATHPEMRDEGEVKLLHEMARLQARRCPRCQYMIVKDGGCDHVHCEKCHFDLDWKMAERVVAPIPTFTPAPNPDPSASSFRGWAHLKEAQAEYITRNNIADTPFDIGNVDNEQVDGVFFYGPEMDIMSPERCEIDAIAARKAGTRLVPAPHLDRDELWAFVEADGVPESEQQGVQFGDIEFATELGELLDFDVGPGDRAAPARVDLAATSEIGVLFEMRVEGILHRLLFGLI